MLLIYVIYTNKFKGGNICGIKIDDGEMYVIDNRDSNINEIVDVNTIDKVINDNMTHKKFSIDKLHKICYLESILELKDKINFKGFTLDDSFGNISLNNNMTKMSRFMSSEVLQRKMLNADNDVYSFEWNEGEKEHMWKCVITDINNILNLIFSEGLFKIIIDFNNSDVKIVYMSEYKIKLLKKLKYHSLNISYKNKQSITDNYDIYDYKDAVKNYIKTYLETNEAINVNQPDDDSNINAKINFNMRCLGDIDPLNIHESFKKLISQSINQKIDIFKTFLPKKDQKRQINIKDLIYKTKPDYNIPKINLEQDSNDVLYPQGNEKFNAHYFVKTNTYEILVSVGEIYEYRFSQLDNEHQDITKFAFRQGFAQNPDGMLFYGSSY